MNDLYRLVYTSTNLLVGADTERAAAVTEILAVSQRNNGKVGVTGALLFNDGCFAQVLEGPRKAVETTFERIQRDTRHSDVSVLQCEPVEARGFPSWSMAFIGHSKQGRALWNEIASRTGFDLSRIDGDHLFSTLRAIVEAEEGLPAEAPPVAAPSRPAPAARVEAAAPLDVERVRAELAQPRPASAPAPDAPVASVTPLARPAEPADAAPASAVLKAALAEERARTTELRAKLDEVRIALAVMTDENQALRQHRDYWADRVKVLLATLCQEPGFGSRGGAASEPQQGGVVLKAVG